MGGDVHVCARTCVGLGGGHFRAMRAVNSLIWAGTILHLKSNLACSHRQNEWFLQPQGSIDHCGVIRLTSQSFIECLLCSLLPQVSKVVAGSTSIFCRSCTNLNYFNFISKEKVFFFCFVISHWYTIKKLIISITL